MRKTEKWRMSSATADETPAEGAEEGHLRRLLTNTINTIEDNKTQIFDIYENMRTEVEETRRRLAELKERVGETIERVDGLAEDERARVCGSQRSARSSRSTRRTRSERPTRQSPSSRSTLRSSARRSSPSASSATSSRSACVTC